MEYFITDEFNNSFIIEAGRINITTDNGLILYKSDQIVSAIKNWASYKIKNEDDIFYHVNGKGMPKRL